MVESALHSVPEEQEPLLHKQATEPKGRKGSSEVSSVAAGPEASSIVYSMSHQRTRGSWFVCPIYLVLLGICVLPLLRLCLVLS